MARRGIHVANPSRPELSPQARILHAFGRVSVKVDIVAVGDLSVCVCGCERRDHRSGIQASIWECFHALKVIFRLTKKLPSSSLLLVFSVSVSWIRHFLSPSIPLDLDLKIVEI
jgi:hypothetical protein